MEVQAAGLSRRGVNNRAQVVGAYWDSTGRAHGYLWERGRMTTIDVPGAFATQPLDINDRGQLVGRYENPNAAPSPQPTVTQPPMGRMS